MTGKINWLKVLTLCCMLYAFPAAGQYCTPIYNVNIGCSGFGNPRNLDDYILVAHGGDILNDTGTGCSSGNYENRSAFFTPPVLVQGVSYHGEALSEGGDVDVKAWIDFADDDIFQPSDTVTNPTFYMLYPESRYPHTISIPAGADTGMHRMRVRMSTSSNMDACSMQVYGETHDYTVRIIPPVANDISAYRFHYPRAHSLFCSKRPIVTKIVMKNFGTTAASGFNMHLEYSGPASGSLQVAYNGTLQPLSDDTATITFIPPLGGSYTLKAYTDLANEAKPSNDTAWTYIEVETTPEALLEDTALCIGDFPLVLDAGNPGCTYLWNTASNSAFIQAFNAGIYTVQITSPLECVTIDTIKLTDHPLPSVAGIAISGSGNTFTFGPGAPEDVTEYSWDLGDGTTSDQEMLMHTYDAPGTYHIRLTVGNACGTDTASFNVIVFPTHAGEDAAATNNILVYPNPASDMLYADIGKAVVEQLLITDSRGSIVYNDRPIGKSSPYVINTSLLAAGNYVLILRSDTDNYYKMFTVIR